MVRHMLHHLRNNLLVNNLQRSLIDDEPVRPHNPRNQRLAQTPSRLDNNLRRIPIHRVESKDNTRNLRIHHLLDPNADEHLLMWEALLLPIENRTGSVQTRPALLYIMDQLLLTLHIEERVLLPSKRSVRQIIACGRGTDRHFHLRGTSLLLQVMIRNAHLLRNIRGHRSRLDDLPNLLRSFLVLLWIPRTIGAVQSLVYDIADPRRLEKATDSVSRNGDPWT